MICVFGDSHRSFFTDTHPGSENLSKTDPSYIKIARKGIFVSYPLGPITAYNVYKNCHADIINALESTSKKHGVIIVAGEIDCRLHIPKIHLETGKCIPELVEETVDRLMLSLLDLRDRGYKVIAWGPHPTRNLETLDYEPEWYAGDQSMRNQTCLAFNGCLAHRAKQEKIPFATTFYNIIKEYDNYTVHDEAYRDQLHLNQLLWPATNKLLGDIYDNYADFQ